MQQQQSNSPYSREMVKGIFFFTDEMGDHTESIQLLKDLKCTILSETQTSITIQATRSCLKELKVRHLAKQDDKSNIASRLQGAFTRILIGGPAH